MKRRSLLVISIIMTLIMMLSTVSFAISKAPVKATPAPKKGGTLYIADSKEVNSLLWYKTNGFNDMVQTMPFYESLFIIDKNGQTQPFLLESCKTDSTALTYTMKLRKGIKFQDGTDLNATALKWNLDKYKAVGSRSKAFFSNIKDFEIKDNYTVIINLSAWDSTIPFALAREAGFMHSQKAFETYGEDYNALHPIGTGPFKLTSWSRDVGKVYKKFKDYWQGEPVMNEINLKIYADSLVAQAGLQAGIISAYFSLDYTVVTNLSKKGYKIATGALPAMMPFITYEMNNKSDYFYDVKVRQAVAYAVDRDAICNTIYNGYAKSTNQFAPSNSPYYSKDVVGYTYDLAKAKKLLADAGYPDGFSTTMIVRNDPVQVTAATAVQAQLAKAGIKVKLNVMESGDFSSNIVGWKSGLFFHTTTFPACVTFQAASMYKQGLSGVVLGLQSWIHPDDINASLVSSVSAKTDVESQKYMQDCQKLLIDKYCMIVPIGITDSTWVKSSKLMDDGLNDVFYHYSTLWKAYVKK